MREHGVYKTLLAGSRTGSCLQMRVGSLFSGIGGMDLGLERAGMEIRWQVELDDYCNKVLEKHWPNVKRFKDVKEIKHVAYSKQQGLEGKSIPEMEKPGKPSEISERTIESVDLLCGGPPCQPFSVAGRRRGAKDDRNLWPETLRIVDLARPRWIVFENVPGVGGYLQSSMLPQLEAQGYQNYIDRKGNGRIALISFPAGSLGAPHRRMRVWIVAYNQRIGWDERASERIQPKIGKAEGSKPKHFLRVLSETRNVADTETSTERIIQGETRGSGSGKVRGNGSKDREYNFWSTEPDVGRVADGIPYRVDRLKGLGNAVVPQVVEWIGRQIMVFNADTYNIRNPDSSR